MWTMWIRDPVVFWRANFVEETAVFVVKITNLLRNYVNAEMCIKIHMPASPKMWISMWIVWIIIVRGADPL